MNPSEWGRYQDRCDTCKAPPKHPCIDMRNGSLLQTAHAGRKRSRSLVPGRRLSSKDRVVVLRKDILVRRTKDNAQMIVLDLDDNYVKVARTDGRGNAHSLPWWVKVKNFWAIYEYETYEIDPKERR